MSAANSDNAKRESGPRPVPLSLSSGRFWAWVRSLSGPAMGLIVVVSFFIILFKLQGEDEKLRRFISFSNLQVLAQTIAVPGVISLGALLIIISGGIDLSVGSVAALVTVITMQVYRHVYFASASEAAASMAAILAGLVTGGACGMADGLMITRLRVSPFVVTLGMLEMARGLAYWLSGRRPVIFPEGVPRPKWVDSLAQVHVKHMLFNPGVWSLILLAIGTAIFLRFTILGRYSYAIGSNEATARLCGVPIGRNKVSIYTLAGLLTGWAGVLMFAHGNSGDPSAGVGLELQVIAAVVIGGASLAGGQGTALGTILGVLILGVLENGVSACDVPVEIKYILFGVIIVVNTALSQWQRRSSE